MLTFHSTCETALSKAAQHRTWDAFMARGTGHSAAAATLPYVLRRCEQDKIPYILKAVPGQGYWIEPLNEERNRQARIKAAEDEARAKREADQAHRARVIRDIAEGLRNEVEAYMNAEGVAEAIMAGRIPHVKVEM